VAEQPRYRVGLEEIRPVDRFEPKFAIAFFDVNRQLESHLIGCHRKPFGLRSMQRGRLSLITQHVEENLEKGGSTHVPLGSDPLDNRSKRHLLILKRFENALAGALKQGLERGIAGQVHSQHEVVDEQANQ